MRRGTLDPDQRHQDVVTHQSLALRAGTALKGLKMTEETQP
jgi:hypothetical protein